MKDIFLVDADDTLLDFHGSAQKGLRVAFAKCGLVWQEEYAKRFKEINDKLWESLERKELTRATLMRERFPLFLAALGLDSSIGETFNRHYLEYLANNPLYIEGAEEFLARLKTHGEVYIVTNGTEWIQKLRFTKSGLFEKANDVFISDAIGADKPAKAYTDYVVAHIENFDVSQAVWIGDSLSADIKAANEAGITSIWFNPNGKTGGGAAKPDYEAKNFDEILKILQGTAFPEKKNCSNV